MGIVNYKPNEKGTFSIYLVSTLQCDLDLDEKGAIDLVETVQAFYDENVYENTYAIIQNDGDNLGIIVDIFEHGAEEDEFVNTRVYMFDDFRS